MGMINRRTTPVGTHWTSILVAGFVGGLTWGVVARVWMRFIATSPEFTWSGTLFVVVGFGVAGLAQSAVYLGRRRHLRRPRLTLLRVLGVLSLLPLGFGAGSSGLPIVVFAPLALTQTGWSRWVRVLAAGVALASAVLVALSIFEDFSIGRAVVGTAWFLAVYAVMVWAAQSSLAPQTDGWSAPLALRVLGVVAVAPILYAASVTLFTGN